MSKDTFSEDTQALYSMPVLDRGFVEVGSIREDVLGTDLKPVNAAKASFSKRAKEMDFRAARLLKFLGREDHTSPSRHAAISFYVKCPLFVSRQWRTHVIASAQSEELCSFNETSGRYVEFEDEFYYPTQYYVQHKDNKQASGDPLDVEHNARADSRTRTVTSYAYNEYLKQLEDGVSREDARIILPQNLYTQFMWTASLQSVAHFVKLRNSSHAQAAIRMYAQAVYSIAEDLFPKTMAMLLSPKKPTTEQLDMLPLHELREYLEARVAHHMDHDISSTKGDKI